MKTLKEQKLGHSIRKQYLKGSVSENICAKGPVLFAFLIHGLLEPDTFQNALKKKAIAISRTDSSLS
jgi:hypothetical protein